MSSESINPFPLGIGSKQNSFEKLQLMANVPDSFKVTAQEFNIIISALNFLYNNNGTGEVPLSGVKILEIGRAWIGGSGSNREIAAASINAGTSFNVPANHLGMVRFHSGIPLQGFPSRFTYFAIKTGAGTYGIGGAQLNASNVVEVNTVFENIETVFNLGNITTNAIDFFANNSGPYIVQDVAKFTATQNDIEKEWLFIGGSGTWGTGAQQTNAAMFIDLADQDPIPVEQIPPVPITRDTFAELVTDMENGLLLKDFIYRSLADGYFHFKGYSDPPFSGDLVPLIPELLEENIKATVATASVVFSRTLDFNAATVYKLTMTGHTTFLIANPPEPGFNTVRTLWLTGNYTLTIPGTKRGDEYDGSIWNKITIDYIASNFIDVVIENTDL